MITVIVQNEFHIQNVPLIHQFQQWTDQAVKHIVKKIPKNCSEVCIAIVNRNTSAQLNETYRHKQGATNVLSFPYESTPGITNESLGDLAICAEIVESEAKKNSLEAHWAHLTIHGLLHLVGYDHIVDQDAEIMEALEIKILNELGFKDPYL